MSTARPPTLPSWRKTQIVRVRLGMKYRYTSVVSHAKVYNCFRTCYAVWHVGTQHSTGGNG